jgi:hypothetical protein
MTKASDNPYPSILVEEGTEPSAPAAGHQRLYIDSTSHKLKRTDSSGTDVTIEGTETLPVSIIDAKGDLIAGTAADTAGRLAVGANGSSLIAASGETTGLKWQLNKLDATAAPAQTDDSGDGYSVGSIWIDVTGDAAYICVDASVGAAVWNPFEAAGGAGDPADVSGGTETTDATYQYNAFTTSGTLTINTEGVADVLIVGGGGGGGGYYSGGGGGGGGVTFLEDVPLTGASMAVVVGAGGAGGSNSSGATDRGTTGLASALGPYATPGGGGGGSNSVATGRPGGSGGGGGQRNDAAGGAGLTGHGYAGGNSRDGNSAGTGGGGGGGGAAAVGADVGASNAGGNGGAGRLVSGFTSWGESGYFGGGGGGGTVDSATAGTGGNGGGGDGGVSSANTGMTAGTANTGGGGGGGGNTGTTGAVGGDGGSGIVIVRTLL